jgi:hypothetical protein
MSENTPRSSRKAPPGQLSQVFVKAKALQDGSGNKDDEYYTRDYYVNLGDVACLFENGGRVVLWRSATQGTKITAYEIRNMSIEKCARALATQGVALVDLEEVSDRIEKKQAAAKFRPMKL